MPRLLPLLLLLLAAAARGEAARAPSWRRQGLGRVLHAAPLGEDALVATAAHVVARVSLASGAPEWRYAAHAAVRAVAAAPDGELLLAAVQDDSVHALAPNGTLLWRRRACTAGFASGAVVIQACGQGGERIFVDAVTGEAVELELEDPDAEAVELATLPEEAPSPLQWDLPAGAMHSAPDGRLSLVDADGADVWVREEGLAHVTAAALFAVPTPNDAALVALSSLGALFGLDARDHGAHRWKLGLPSRDCVLVTGHRALAVAVCRGVTSIGHEDHNALDDSVVVAADAVSGRLLLKETVPGFRAEQAALECAACCAAADAVCVRLVNAEGQERPVASAGCGATDGALREHGWLSFRLGGTELKGMRGGAVTWRIALPGKAAVAAVAVPRRPHQATSHVRPPAVRVTAARELLFKYVEPDVALLLAENKEDALVHAMLVNVATGSVMDAVTHREAAGPVVAIRGDNWFVYSFWSALMLQQEVHIIDLYEPPRNRSAVHDALRDAAEKTFGSQVLRALQINPGEEDSNRCQVSLDDDSDDGRCAAQALVEEPKTPVTPIIVRSSMLTTARITGLDVTQTQLGVTEPSVVVMLESGQVTLVSKIWFDARRPKDGSRDKTEFLPRYSPVLFLWSTSLQSEYLYEGGIDSSLRAVAVAPVRGRESQTQITAFGTDVRYSVVQTVGAFDSLPSDFVYSAVIGMLVCLGGAVFYTQRLKAKALLSRSW